MHKNSTNFFNDVKKFKMKWEIKHKCFTKFEDIGQKDINGESKIKQKKMINF